MTGVVVGLGSAARSISSTSKGNLVKSGYSGPEKYIIATPLLLRFGPK